MKRALITAVLVSLLAACGGGTDEAPLQTGTGRGGDEEAVRTPDVEQAPRGKVNTPVAGTYVYDYESESTNAATPDATPRRSQPGAELSSEVTIDGDIVTIADSTTEGAAVATVKRRFSDDGISELSFETKAGDQSSGCAFDDPIEIVPLPFAEGELFPQSFEGEGNNCDGERTVTVEESEDVTDAAGVIWPTWRIKFANVVRGSLGVRNEQTVTLWFAPDLGKEVKLRSVSETLNPEGQVAVRGEQSFLLKSHPA